MTKVCHFLRLHQLNTHAREAIYGVTAQSHFRAMALITRVDSWNDKIADAKVAFTDDLDALEALGGPGVQESVDRMREIDGRFADAGAEALRLYEAGNFDRALDLHISAEHEISHELEDELNVLIDPFGARVEAASAELSSLKSTVPRLADMRSPQTSARTARIAASKRTRLANASSSSSSASAAAKHFPACSSQKAPR